MPGIFQNRRQYTGLPQPCQWMLACQTKRRNAIDNPKINRLCPSSGLTIHLVKRHPEHIRGCLGMNIYPVSEGFQHRGFSGNMGHKPQFNLTIVGRNKLMTFFGDKGISNLHCPSCVRIGIFCKFGSEEDNLPVDAPTIENEVCTRFVFWFRLALSASV